MSRAGEEPARIADKLKIPLEQVEQCIKSFEAARVSVSSDIVDMVVNAEVLTAMTGVGERLQSAQRATRFTGVYNAQGDPITEPDHSTALEAIKVGGELLAQVRPKGGGVNVAVGINNNGNGGGTSTVKTFEQRVREKRGMLPDGDVKFLSDGKGEEIVDAEMVDDDEDAENGDLMMDGTSDLEIEEADSNNP
jgi:hypothetical protein